jgi:hypothetical protein
VVNSNLPTAVLDDNLTARVVDINPAAGAVDMNLTAGRRCRYQPYSRGCKEHKIGTGTVPTAIYGTVS